MQKLADGLQSFRLPTYTELPDFGLYLEQATLYLNQTLSCLGFPEITGSMIRNYVKKGLIANPVNKRYYADQLAHLIAVSLLKHVLPLENIQILFQRQRRIYTDQKAFDYFGTELQNVLFFQLGLKDTLDEVGQTHSTEKEMLRSAIIALGNLVYLNGCFRLLAQENEE